MSVLRQKLCKSLNRVCSACRFLHYIQAVTPAIPPASALPITPVAPSSGEAAGGGASFTAPVHASQPAAPTAAVPATSGPASAAQVAPIVAAAQAALANTVNVSPQAQQAVKLEAFNQLVASLVNQIHSGKVALPANWPAGGVTAQLQTMLTALLQQATAGQPLPQQLVSVQSWPTVLAQAVLQLTGQAAETSTPTGSPRAPWPALQNWLVQQGVVQAQDGERAFTLTLRVPVAWAQAQAALGAALPPASGAALAGAALAGAAPAGGGALPTGGGAGLPGSWGAAPGMLQLPFAGSVQQLASGALGLVMQPQALPGSTAAAAAAAQAMRTSAVLQLEFQPLAAAVQNAQVASLYMPAPMLAQDVQAMLQGRGTDPWLLMAQAQADGQGQKQRPNANEQAQFCNRAGCQYQGRAICAQPFCAEMNYLWSIDRAQRR